MGASRIVFVAVAVLLTAIWRVAPHVFNVGPSYALALFAGACLADRKRPWSVGVACILPLLAQLASDIVIERMRPGVEYEWRLMACVYATLIVSTGFGMLVSKRWRERKFGPLWLSGSGVASWAVFFVVTNFADWAFMSHHQKTLAGLIECYVGGWLFDPGRSLLGILAFQALLFGGWLLLPNRVPEASSQIATAN